MSLGRLTFPITSLFNAAKLAKQMDILQFNTFVAGTFGPAVGRLAKKPTVLFCHELFHDLWKSLGHNFIEKNLYKHIENFIVHQNYNWFLCPSEYSKRTLVKAGVPKNKISVVPHGIDFDIFNLGTSHKGLKKKFKLSKNKTFGFTGRLSVKGVGHSKNLLGLFEAASIVIKEVPDAKLILGGKNFEDLNPYLEQFGIKDHVVFLGRRPFDEVPLFYNTCDAVVCPAIVDGYCFLTAEASACGRPLVVTNGGSHPERVLHNETGLVADVAPESLADNIIKLLTDDNLRKKFGKNAHKFSKQFTWDKAAKMHLKVYEKLID